MRIVGKSIEMNVRITGKMNKTNLRIPENGAMLVL